jgi:hypothetical protein
MRGSGYASPTDAEGPSGRKSGDLDLAPLQTPFLSQYLELFSSDCGQVPRAGAHRLS